MGLFYMQYEDVIWLFFLAKQQVIPFSAIYVTHCNESQLERS